MKTKKELEERVELLEGKVSDLQGEIRGFKAWVHDMVNRGPAVYKDKSDGVCIDISKIIDDKS